VWRGSVIGPAPEGNTVALRRYAGAVHDDALGSASRLLELLPKFGNSWSADIGEVRLGTAKGKVNVLALLEERPRIVLDGEDGQVGQYVDVRAILDGGGNPLTEIFHGNFNEFVQPRDLPGGRSLAARIIHPARPGSRILDALKGCSDEDILRSQCLDFDCIEALRNDSVEEFLAKRSGIMNVVIQRNVQRNALFGFPDGPEPASLFGDEGGSDGGE
jgi:hypothetical protein